MGLGIGWSAENLSIVENHGLQVHGAGLLRRAKWG
jgi:hypothetical protein